ncbi:MAG TPA: efflux RND transporter permease subunit [Hellea balneolensis]|uniref:Efflux RND transporter permease subunit n=1 Tax=Hellea balneolensis TaxID=287478 RepID=A0A7C3GAD9_9PROT|nr:efflux RND transporter permease subunit [Hellea balneolensis]
MSFAARLLSRPHAIIALLLAGILLGFMGYLNIPTNLFPDTNRLTIAVVVQWPGAMSTDIANEVTHPLEVRLSAIDGVRRVTSTSRDEVSSVQVEFEYGNEINTAANQVSTELSRVKGQLPEHIREPLIFKITDAARPVLTLGVRAAPGSDLSLGQVRRIAEHDLRDDILNLPKVSEVEIFGGPVRQVHIDVDRDKLNSYGLDLGQLAAVLTNSNVSQPAGLVHQDGRRYLLTAQTLAKTPAEIGAILVPLPSRSFIRVRDVAQISWGAADATSLYHSNGQPSVAIAILRSEKGFSKPLVKSVDAAMANLQAKYPNLQIEIADTQGRIIGLIVNNMLGSLRDAVIMTLLVILLFLGNTRAALVVALSLPVSYMLTFAVLWALGFEFDMVTLSAIIIAVGLLADDVVVVMENIERRMREENETKFQSAVRGLDEILLADTSGTISTIIVLVPIMFIGGYVQTVLRPLSVTLSVALLASLVVSVTMIPFLAPFIIRPEEKRDPLSFIFIPFNRFFLSPLKRFYIALVRWGLGHRAIVLFTLLFMAAISFAHIRLQGRELMPLMDTGITRITFEAAPDTDTAQMKTLMGKVEATIDREVPKDWIISVSTVVGAEPGVKSFGSSRLLQQGELTLNLIDRFHRDRTVYDINRALEQRLRKTPGLISANVAVFGATPLSSIRANVDVMVSGPDPAVLNTLADQIMKRLKTVHGLTGMERSWQSGSSRIELNVNPALARQYGLTSGQIASQLSRAVRGLPGGRLRVNGEDPITIWVRLAPNQRDTLTNIRAIPITLANGHSVPLDTLAQPRLITAPTAETHQYLQPTIDILAWRNNIAITALHSEVQTALQDIILPRNYQIHYEGEIKQLSESFGRLGKAFGLGLILLYLMLVITFKSFLDPLAIMFSLPLAVIGAASGLLIADKLGSMPAFMGMILLMGIIINNGILLVDFAKVSLDNGEDLQTALLGAVEKRTRPILMTAFASAVGMIPLAMEWAVGIERLSPLAVVAIGGLIAGTFLTLLAVPLFYSVLVSMRARYSQKLHVK